MALSQEPVTIRTPSKVEVDDATFGNIRQHVAGPAEVLSPQHPSVQSVAQQLSDSQVHDPFLTYLTMAT